MGRQLFHLVWGLLLVSSLAGPALAQDTASRQQARQRFERGMELVEDERWEEALESFDESLRLYQSQAALFNRALCLGLLARPAEAMAALEEHVRRYGSTVSRERQAEVEAELSRLRRRVGRVEVRVEGAPSATVLVDGRDVGQAPLAQPVLVNSGRRRVTVRAQGFTPVTREVNVEAGDQVSVVIAMEGGTELGTIAVEVNIPEAQVSLDGAVMGSSPLSDPITAAVGRHVVEVRRDGFVAERREIEVTTGEETAIAVTLEVETGTRAPIQTQRADRGLRIGAWVTAGVALATLGTALGLFLWNNSQFNTWETEDAAIRDALSSTTVEASIVGRVDDNNELHQTIGNVSVATWVMMGVGAASAAAAVVLFVLSARRGRTAPVALLPTPGGLTLAGSWTSPWGGY